MVRQVELRIERDMRLNEYTSTSAPENTFCWRDQEIYRFSMSLGNRMRSAASAEEIEFRLVYADNIKPQEKSAMSWWLTQRGFGKGHRCIGDGLQDVESAAILVEEQPVSDNGVLIVRYSAKIKSGAYIQHPVHKVHTILTPQQIAEEVQRHAIETNRRSVEYGFLVSADISENCMGWFLPQYLSFVLKPNLEALEKSAGGGATAIMLGSDRSARLGLTFEKYFDTELGKVHAPDGMFFVDYENLTSDRKLTKKEVDLLNKLSKHAPKGGEND